MIDQCITPTVKHGGGSVMVWGCFGNGKTGDLKKIDGILNKEGYHQILCKHAVPSGKKLMDGKKFFFQQDNDPKHTSKLCKNYIGKKEQEGVLEILDHPPQSPDCNPIELLWDEMDREIRMLRSTNVNDLWLNLQREWSSISEETILKLTNRMPRICKAVIKARGGYFDETKV